MAALQNEKRIGWTNVGELENCVHFKIGKTYLLIHTAKCFDAVYVT